METAKYDWLGAGDKEAKLNNWAPWIMSNYLTAALLLETDSEQKGAWSLLSPKLTDQYLNGLGADGACEEGPTYWAFGPVTLSWMSCTSWKAPPKWPHQYFSLRISSATWQPISIKCISAAIILSISGTRILKWCRNRRLSRGSGIETGDTTMRGFGNWFDARNNYANSLSQQDSSHAGTF